MDIFSRAMDPFYLATFKEKVPKGTDFKPPFFKNDPVSLARIEYLAQQVHPLIGENENTEQFWIRMHNVEVGGGFKYRDLTNGVIKMLVLPLSNAEVERTFSATKYFKYWKRSRINFDLLRAMCHCKFGLIWLGKRPHEYEIPQELLNFNSDIYGK